MSNIPVSEMFNIRVFYTKKNRAKYISHLDITRCMQRALKRAELPIWYTQGFNPHIYLTFSLPLALGYESECESMDLRLVTFVEFDEVKEKLNSSLPPDIRVTKVALQKNKPQVIKTALYNVTLSSQTLSGKDLKDCLDNLFSYETIDVIKRTKKGNKTVDIKPDINITSTEVFDNAIKIFMITCAGIDKNINPDLLINELTGKYNLENIKTSIIRLAVYDEDHNEFE